MRSLFLLLFAFLLAGFAGAGALAAETLESAVESRIPRVTEFQFIRSEAEKMGVRVWLFGGTAAGFGHYVKWDLQREAGDKRFQPDRFDYDYSNIYRSTQDLDIVVDGTPQQVEALQAKLEDKFHHFQGSRTAWEVRSLREKVRDKEPLLNNPDFLNQHTDSNSTGMIEITKPAPGEPVVRDLRAWQDPSPAFLTDLKGDKLHFYFSPSHFTTSRAKAGLNPPILSVLRYLTKAFQYELEVDPESLKHLQSIIASFNPKKDLTTDYARGQLEKNAKKMIQHAVNLEYARSALDELGLRGPLTALGNPEEMDSMAWWLNKMPLESKPLGSGKGATAAELARKGKWALGPKGEIIVAHETNNFLAYESITRAHTGEPNVFISRNGFEGESAAYGDGFYTRLGKEGARNTGITIRFTLDPEARKGADFEVQGDYVVVKNKNAIRVIPESLNLDPTSYFRFLLAAEDIDSSDKALMEKLRRRMNAQMGVLSPGTLKEIQGIVREEIKQNGYKNKALLTEWFRIPQSVALSADLLAEAEKSPEKKLTLFALQTGQPHWEKTPFFRDLTLDFVLRGLAKKGYEREEEAGLKALMARYNDPTKIPPEEMRKAQDFLLRHVRAQDRNSRPSFMLNHWAALPWASDPTYSEEILLAMRGKGEELHKRALNLLVYNQRMDFMKKHPEFITNAPDWATAYAVQAVNNPSLEFLKFMLDADWKKQCYSRVAEKLGNPALSKQPGWADLVNRLLASGEANKEIAGMLRIAPEAASHPEWFEALLAKGTVNDTLVHALSSGNPGPNHVRWMNTLLKNTRDFKNHDIDAHFLDVLNEPGWKARPEWRGWIDILLAKDYPTYNLFKPEILRPADVDKLLAKKIPYTAGRLATFLLEGIDKKTAGLAPEFRDPAWIRERLDRIVRLNSADADIEILKRMKASPALRKETGWISQFMQRPGKTAEYAATTILSLPESAAHPEWLLSLLSQEADEDTLGSLNNTLDEKVLSKPHWRKHPKLLELSGGEKPSASKLRMKLAKPDDARPLFEHAVELIRKSTADNPMNALKELSSEQLTTLALAKVEPFDRNLHSNLMEDIRSQAQAILTKRKDPRLLEWLKDDLGKTHEESRRWLRGMGAEHPAQAQVVLDFWKSLQPLNSPEKKSLFFALVRDLEGSKRPIPPSLWPVVIQAIDPRQDSHPLRYNGMEILKHSELSADPELRQALFRSLADESSYIRVTAVAHLEAIGESSAEYRAKIQEFTKDNEMDGQSVRRALDRLDQAAACPKRFQGLVR